MMLARLIRLWARRLAMRRISWTAQRINGDEAFGLLTWSFGGSFLGAAWHWRDGLAALAKDELQRDPFSGTILVFRSKRADRLKILAWDGSGLILYWQPLGEGAVPLAHERRG